MHHVQVLLLVMTADVVGFAWYTLRHHGIERAGMILNVEPVADLIAFAINRQRFAIKGVKDHQRDQLLGEVIRAVVIGAVGDQRRQTIGTTPCAHQVIA